MEKTDTLCAVPKTRCTQAVAEWNHSCTPQCPPDCEAARNQLRRPEPAAEACPAPRDRQRPACPCCPQRSQQAAQRLSPVLVHVIGRLKSGRGTGIAEFESSI